MCTRDEKTTLLQRFRTLHRRQRIAVLKLRLAAVSDPVSARRNRDLLIHKAVQGRAPALAQLKMRKTRAARFEYELRAVNE